MDEPIVFVSHFRIKEGKLEAFKAHARETSQMLQEDKPLTSAFLPYIGDDGGVTIVHVFAHANAMDAHVQGADERSEAVDEFIEPDGWEVYGMPSAGVLQTLKQGAEASGVRLLIRSENVGGFLRL